MEIINSEVIDIWGINANLIDIVERSPNFYKSVKVLKCYALEGQLQMLKYLPEVEDVFVTHVIPEDIEYLALCRKIKRLNIHSKSNIKPYFDFSRLAHCPILDISAHTMELKSEHISKFKSLTSLVLAWCKLNSFDFIGELPNLSKLWINTPSITDLSIFRQKPPIKELGILHATKFYENVISDFSPLYGLKGLRTLNLKGTDISKAQLIQLKSHLGNIRYEDAIPKKSGWFF